MCTKSVATRGQRTISYYVPLKGFPASIEALTPELLWMR